MIRLLPLLAAGALVWPSGTAVAHVLSAERAELKARSEAYQIAGELRSRPAISVRSSKRVSHHVVDVRVRFQFRDEARTCRVLTIRVRLIDESSRRLSVRFPAAPRRC